MKIYNNVKDSLFLRKKCAILTQTSKWALFSAYVNNIVKYINFSSCFVAARSGFTLDRFTIYKSIKFIEAGKFLRIKKKNNLVELNSYFKYDKDKLDSSDIDEIPGLELLNKGNINGIKEE